MAAIAFQKTEMPNAGTAVIITRNYIKIARTGTVNGDSAILNTGKGMKFFLVGEKLLHSQSFAMPAYAGIISESGRILPENKLTANQYQD